MARYAIYFTPRPGSALYRFGEAWFGAAGAGAVPDGHARLTSTPRRYGFHATLKAPFRLAAGAGVEDLSAEIAAFAAVRGPVACGRLAVGRLGGFVALLPERPPAALGALAADCVRHFDRFRAAWSPAEFTRRAEGLSAETRSNLAEYGYPWVLNSYRFHMTLTGRVTDGEWARLKPVLDDMWNAVREPPVVDALSLLREPAAGLPFEIVNRFALSGAAAVS
jgi:hypothetical protein